MENELIQVTTADDLILSGLYKSGEATKPAVVLIHGFTSDFYSHKFFHLIQSDLTTKDYANVAIQTRGTGIRTEVIQKDREDSKWIGSFYEVLSDAHLDISAWIEFLQSKGHESIILIGHSLGTIKTVRYLFEGEYKDQISKIILLAPFDKNGYLQDLNEDERWRVFAEDAAQKVAEGKGEETIPANYDDYPMSYQTYASWYEDSDLSNMWDFYRGEEYDFPTMNQIKVPVQIVVGDADPFFFLPKFSTMESTVAILKENIKDLDLEIISGSGHTYLGYEDQVKDLVSKFFNK